MGSGWFFLSIQGKWLRLDQAGTFPRVGHGLSESASSPLPSAPSFGLVAIAVPDEGSEFSPIDSRFTELTRSLQISTEL